MVFDRSNLECVAEKLLGTRNISIDGGSTNLPRAFLHVAVKVMPREVLELDFWCFIREVLLSPDHSMGNQGWDRREISYCSASYMFDDRKRGGNAGKIIYSGAAEDDQQHFPEEAPEL